MHGAPNKGEVKRIASQLCIDISAVDVQRLLDLANVFYLRGLGNSQPLGERNRFIIKQFKSGKTQKEIAEMLQPPMKATRVNQVILEAGLSRWDGGAHVRKLKREAAQR